jgi:hypothetical protein
LVECLVLTWGC